MELAPQPYAVTDEIIPMSDPSRIEVTQLRQWPEFGAPKPTRALPLLSGVFPLGMVVGGRRQHNEHPAPIFFPYSPLPEYIRLVSSDCTERMAMAFAGRTLAAHYEALFYVTQLAAIDTESKKMVTSPSVNWETGNIVEKMWNLLGGRAGDAPNAVQLGAMYPIDALVETVKGCIGNDIFARDVYVNMRPVNGPVTPGKLTFPIGDRTTRADDVHVPVVMVEPLRLVPATYNLDAPGRKFEWQMLVIAGDVLIVPFKSEHTSITCAHKCALEIAAEHHVYYVRCIVAFDMSTMQIHTTHYYWPVLLQPLVQVQAPLAQAQPQPVTDLLPLLHEEMEHSSGSASPATSDEDM